MAVRTASPSPDRGTVDSGRRRLRVVRWQGASPVARRDEVAVEEPLEIRVETRPVAVVMRTPGHDDELAAGFLLSEGLIHSAADLRGVRRSPRNREGNVLEVFLASGVPIDYARLTRHVFGASSCGLCGKATIAAVRTQFPKVRGDFRVAASVVLELPDRMREVQSVFGATGGLHAAGLFSSEGRLEGVREDVGRHNAVDKLLGRALFDGRLPLNEGLLLVSGRASFEILQKALAGGIPVVASVGAPSSLAVDFARRNGQTLVGFLREGRFNVYAGAQRLVGAMGGRAGKRSVAKYR